MKWLVPETVTSTALPHYLPIPAEAPEFYQEVQSKMIIREGDILPVSALPVDGVYPTRVRRNGRNAI